MAEAVYPMLGSVSSNMLNGGLRYLMGWKGPTGFGSRATAAEVVANWNGTGKTVIITGATGGLGGEAARVLASKGAEVVLAVRDIAKGQALAKSITAQHPKAKLVVMELELSSQASVRAFATAFKATKKPLNVLFCNAAIMAKRFRLSEDGKTDSQFATNHTGHFLLTQLLLDTLIATAKASKSEGRVVVMSSLVHWKTYSEKQGGPIRLGELAAQKKGYNPWQSYGQSKLANLMFARELNQRLKGEPVIAVACHPGIINTGLNAHLPAWANAAYKFFTSWGFLKSVPQGAATGVLAATGKGIHGGEYYADCNITASSRASTDANLGRALWEFSEQLVAAGEKLPAGAKRLVDVTAAGAEE